MERGGQRGQWNGAEWAPPLTSLSPSPPPAGPSSAQAQPSLQAARTPKGWVSAFGPHTWTLEAQAQLLPSTS